MVRRRYRNVSLTALALSVTLLGHPLSAVPGELDTTFGGDGVVITSLSARWDTVFAVAIQADGKIVTAGGVWGKGGRFSIARYNQDGSVDPSFGGDGRVATNFTRGYDAAWGIAIQPDGNIVAAGDAGLGSGDSMFALARYKANGKLDRTFGGDGRVTTQLTDGDDPVAAMVLQPNGRIVVAGGADYAVGRGEVALVRYRSRGKLDRTFGRDGKVTAGAGPGASFANALALQPDGKILAGGMSRASKRRSKFSVFRFTRRGRLDRSFGGDGLVATGFPGRKESVQGLAVQPDGAIVAAGIMGAGDGNEGVALARYSPGGALDPSFGAGGIVTSQPAGGSGKAWGLALQNDGRILAIGEAGGEGGQLAVGRYETNGDLDPTFGSGGWVLTNLTGGRDIGWDLAIQADGKILAVGGTNMDRSKVDSAMVRYLPS